MDGCELQQSAWDVPADGESHRGTGPLRPEPSRYRRAGVDRGAGGAFATIDNGGTGLFNLTTLGVGAQSGSILSAAPVVLNASLVHGSVQTGGTLTGLAVTGTVTQFSNPVLPQFPTLSVTFPFTLTDVNVLPLQTLSLAPGSYNNVNVPPGGTLVLNGSGVYKFNTLNIAPAATIRIDNTLGTVTVYVQTNVISLGAVSSNALPNQFVLGYTGILPVI
jgi:hypothetical protein